MIKFIVQFFSKSHQCCTHIHPQRLLRTFILEEAQPALCLLSTACINWEAVQTGACLHTVWKPGKTIAACEPWQFSPEEVPGRSRRSIFSQQGEVFVEWKTDFSDSLPFWSYFTSVDIVLFASIKWAFRGTDGNVLAQCKGKPLNTLYLGAKPEQRGGGIFIELIL